MLPGIAPLVHLEAMTRQDANRLLVRWEHRMGPYNRPNYALEAHHALFHNGEPVAVAMSGETVREVVAQTRIRREEAVELVRLCAARPGLNRAMLRLWREFVLPSLLDVHGRRVAVSYSDESLHRGDVYRFDGWADLGKAGPGGNDARTGRAHRALRVWAYPPAEARAMVEERAA